jgi:hypothetical protein
MISHMVVAPRWWRLACESLQQLLQIQLPPSGVAGRTGGRQSSAASSTAPAPRDFCTQRQLAAWCAKRPSAHAS